MKVQTGALGGVAVWFLGWATLASAAQITFTPVVRNGQSVPGVPGATFDWFHNPVINDDGTVAFIGRFVGGPDVTALNNRGILEFRPDGTLNLLVRSGEPGPANRPAVLSFEHLRSDSD